MILEHGEFPEQLELFGAALGRRRPSGSDHRFPAGLRNQQQLLLHEFLDEFIVQTGGLGVVELGRLFDAVGQGSIHRGHERNQPLSGILPPLPVEGRLEHGPQSVVIGLRDGIVAVVVALGAVNRDAEQRRRNDLKGVGDDLIARQLRLRRTVARRIGGHAQETGGHQTIQIAVGQIGGDGRQEFVASQLLGDEIVEGAILVEGPDHVVAVSPGPRTLGIGLHAPVGVGISRHIEPVTPPTFTISRRIQKPIHPALVGGIGRVRHEGIDFFWSRRKTSQVEGQPADQLLRFRGLGKAQALLLQSHLQERIDGSPHRLVVSDLGRLRTPHRLERPELTFLFGDDPSGHLHRFGSQGRSALRDPPFDERHLLRSQWLAAFGHFTGFHHRQEMTLGRLSWHQH